MSRLHLGILYLFKTRETHRSTKNVQRFCFFVKEKHMSVFLAKKCKNSTSIIQQTAAHETLIIVTYTIIFNFQFLKQAFGKTEQWCT
jgi:hypothetical protein